MKIIFNLISCGLGNNGGSLTIIKSANTLQKLGYKVTIIDSMRNQHTWIKLQCDHIIVKKEKQIPDADIVIATGIKTVSHTEKLPKRCGKKLWWLRGNEIWNYPQLKLNNIYKTTSCKIIVNSICLKGLLENLGITSDIIRPGNDLQQYKDLNIRRDDKIILGGLHNLRHRKIKRMDWIFRTTEIIKKKYSNTELWMMGGDKSNSSIINKYFRNPSITEKNILFSNVHIWLAPTSLEGLHIPPQESMLCDACVVGTNAHMSGMKDYLINDMTGLTANDFDEFTRQVQYLIENPKLRIQMAKNGRNKIIQLGDRVSNMKKLIKLLEDYL